MELEEVVSLLENSKFAACSFNVSTASDGRVTVCLIITSLKKVFYKLSLIPLLSFLLFTDLGIGLLYQLDGIKRRLDRGFHGLRQKYMLEEL